MPSIEEASNIGESLFTKKYEFQLIMLTKPRHFPTINIPKRYKLAVKIPTKVAATTLTAIWTVSHTIKRKKNSRILLVYRYISQRVCVPQITNDASGNCQLCTMFPLN